MSWRIQIDPAAGIAGSTALPERLHQKSDPSFRIMSRSE
jgi:hypothetical protein